MNCPDCGAHNPDTATFCSLCMRSFAPPAPPSGTDVPAAPDVPDVPDAPVAESAGERPPGAGTATRGRFRRTEEGFDWQCDRCQSWSPLELTACHVCARPFRAAMGEEVEDTIDASVNPALAIGVSAVLPGLGHILLGRPGTGSLRLGLSLLWLLSAIAFVAQSDGVSAAGLASIPLFVGAAVMAVVSVLDVRLLLQGSKRTVLTNRVFLWLVIGVFVATLLAMLPSVLQAASGAGP